MAMRNQVQLITYPDLLGGSLHDLREILRSHFQDIFCGVHILPPYPSSGDRGFAPLTYFEIDPRLGTWEDVRDIGATFDVLVDLMVNHISRQSPYFQDFIQNGRESKYAGLFITLDKIWPGSVPNPADVAKIFLRRPEHPFSDILIQSNGQVERVWSTFGTRDWSEQMDLDVHDPTTRYLFREILAHLSHNGVKMVRLDAIAFVIKKPGTTCFFVEPEIYAFIDWIETEARVVGIELLPEVHADFPIQLKLAEHGHWVYNFALPLLVLHTLLDKDSTALKEHLRVCPRRQITMLDCHDGIPVQPDLDGILGVDEAQKVVADCLARGANLNRIYSVAHRLRPDFDAHQINITYYSALNADDAAYLAARAIQFFTPGIPQVYYVGLLAGENDPSAVLQTGENRAINRHNYTTAEVETAIQKPVVQRLMRLARFRNTYPAFDGEFEILPTGERHLHLRWRKDPYWCSLQVDLNHPASQIHYRAEDGTLQELE